MIVVAWLLLLALLTFLFNRYLEHSHNPNQHLVTREDAGGHKQVTLQINRSGHYVASGKINGRPAIFLLDTGATAVAIPGALENHFGLNRGPAINARTASGITTSYLTQLDSVTIGDITLENIRANIVPAYESNEVLLGMSFLKHLEIRHQGETLTLIQ